MARARFHAIRRSATLVFDGVSTFTLGSFPLAELTDGIANLSGCYVDIVTSFFTRYSGSVGAFYAHLFSSTVFVEKSAGPIYTFSVPGFSDMHDAGDGISTTGLIISACAFDQNSGNLRLRYNSALVPGLSISTDVMSSAATMGP